MIRLLNKLHRDQKGTALTEFVITLPLFVLTFIFMVDLGRYEADLCRIRYRAATNMWDQAMSAPGGPDNTDTTVGLPPMAASNARSIIGGNTSFAGDNSANAKNGGLAAGGTNREAVTAPQSIGLGSPPFPTAGGTFPRKMVVDSPRPDPIPTGSGPLAVFNRTPPRTITVTRHAAILGARYGMVSGEHSALADGGHWRSITFKAQYDILLSPVSMPQSHEEFVVGASRLTAEEDGCLSTVLKVDASADLGC